MSYAETQQRNHISAFLRDKNIPIPNYSSPSDLAAAITAALDHLDGGSNGGGARQASAEAQLQALRRRRGELQNALDEGIQESSRLQRTDESETQGTSRRGE